MIDCAFIIYALDDAFFYSKGRRDVNGDMRMDAIGAVIPCGFGFGVLYVMTIYELNYISYSNLVYYNAMQINYL